MLVSLALKWLGGGDGFQSGEGIVADNVESTIANVGCLGREGMKETDRVIIHLMTGEA